MARALSIRLNGLILGVLLPLLAGCQGVPQVPIRAESMVVDEGSRILLASVERGLLKSVATPLDFEVDVPAGRLAGLPGGKAVTVSLEKLDPELLDRAGAVMALLVERETSVLRRYGPYREVEGFEEQTRRIGIRNGKPVYDHRTVPVYRTAYRHRCTRIDYRVYQYDRSGAFIGQARIEPSPPPECPDRAEADIVHDARPQFEAWLRSKGSPVPR